MEENYELAKWLAGDMSPEELRAFEARPEFATYAKIARYSTQLEAPSFDADSMYRKITVAPKATKVILLYQKTWFKIAATITILLGITLFYKTNVAISEISENGELKSFALPDDSHVVLNSGSSINYSKWGWDKNRSLDLNGEAYFKVAKGKKFEVNTNLGTVTVLGTQFDVKARKNRFDVVCYEGRVKVNYQNHEVIITKGKAVSFENGIKLNIPNHLNIHPSWMTGEFSFIQEHLDNIIDEMERHFNVDIECKSSGNGQLFTGSIPQLNLDQALAIISSTYHLKVQKVNSQKIILQVANEEK
ncbi:FecR family protein [Flavobacterium sp. CYK-55]|uniref:FecR family protein n=1 Tax=Flavobacterium sp. CYK-55 TaxID=2835529 RepID=UPI001BCF0CC7|nr:FecR family protein [Flavobacterium sp. CYK-55]MBS7786349.1 FecR family protein [Flavobacterium sp. CYK-55]